MIEQMFVHKMPIAKHALWAHRIVLIQIEGDHIAKTKPFFIVQSYQFFIDFQWR